MNLLKAIGGILPGAASAGIQAASGNWTGAAQTAASTLGGFMSAHGQERENRAAEDRAYVRNLDMMRQQNDFNVKMWNMANEYNAPSNQLQLLKDAGVNPAMYDFGSGGSQASEVTAASADVPYNSKAGEYSNPAQKVLETLSMDAQIEKLRNDIKYQKLLNRDYEMLVRSHEMPLYRADDLYDLNDVKYDEDGNPYEDYGNNNFGKNTFNAQPYNYYVRKMLDERDDREDVFLQRALKRDEYEVYHDSKGVLKQMSRQQLEHLKQDLRAKILDNSLTSSI